MMKLLLIFLIDGVEFGVFSVFEESHDGISCLG